MIRELSVEKIRKKLESNNLEILRIDAIKKDNEELERLLKLVSYYGAMQRLSSKADSYTTSKARRAIKLMDSLPLWTLKYGEAGVTSYIESYESDVTLYEYANYDNNQLLKSGFPERILKCLRPYLKSKKELVEMSLSNAS